MLQEKEQKAFTILPKSAKVLPKSFTILPKSADVLPKSFKILPRNETSQLSKTNKQYIKEAHQSFVVLGKANKSEDDAIEDDILDITSTASSRDTIRLSEDDFKDEETIIRKPRRLLPLHKPLAAQSRRNTRWYNRNNWVHQPTPQRKV